ncbi:MAG: amino acid ABC transporter permease [Rhodospirillaceae bacterium]|jgi:general L-amino acid transport system permease protein|uniref:amino acid ABC transporter permease n=1 Tax=unclassified Hwanghaeella TaxID=2605944 RepID=UPI000C3C4853|nr:amino acid ABC transporter permease [Rhodospirillales bacterium]MAX48214.1 amino acid ABC transporter permease [Rhodospirillaceae bacterium]|tara:strand:- start:61891 stop:63006 length:1116 start_codon:yes stop_codon:yes gene_type:complete
MSDAKSYEPGQHPSLAPPKNLVGWQRWIWDNLFGTVTNTVLTLLSVYLLYLIVPGILDYFIFDAVVNASSRAECAELGKGACWAFIGDRFQVFIYGFYPNELRWRPNLTFVLLFVALAPVLYDNIPFRKYGLMFSLAFPIIAGVLMVGGVFGLEPVDTRLFGGVLLTIVIGVTGITFSLPLGILLALGRYSNLPAIKIVCTVFIEFIRGVPLITLLFVASTMLSYFLPPGTTFDLLLRVLIMVTLFASAYMAEVIRGGLQSLPKGQFEAADAMGLKYWQTMRLIVLPQALKISIPGIVNTFIGLYKDTTLVIVIGMLDVLGVAKSAVSDPVWNGLSVEIYVFVAGFFFICCFGMSRYSMYLEKKLHTGHKR